MAVTVNAVAQNMELMEPVHIVISEISSPRPFISQRLKDFIFSKLPDWVENYRPALLNMKWKDALYTYMYCGFF